MPPRTPQSTPPPGTPAFALDPELNVRFFACENASSYAAASRFVPGAPFPWIASWAVVIENPGEGTPETPVETILTDQFQHGIYGLNGIYHGKRSFLLGNPGDLLPWGRTLPPKIGEEVNAAFTAFYTTIHPASVEVMGILNVTPDSFSDGGQWVDPDAAVERALQMAGEGASIIDIGGESSRPGAPEIPADEEHRRVLPVLQRLRPQTDARLSIDTRKSEVARACLDMGADMINDVSGLTADPALAEVVARFPQAQLVVMHQRRRPAEEAYSTEYNAKGQPQYEDVVADTLRWLRRQATFAVEQGVRPEQLWIDPGFGFGKTYEQNVELLRRVREYTSAGLPVLLGTSRKSSIGKMQGGGERDDRLEGSLATACWAVSQGVRAVRVHDVRETARAVRVAETLRPRLL